MNERILGIHHITAIAGNAKRNYDFYTRVLGLRMVKKTVNFDDPRTYHFYFANEDGSPGTVLTFFPWEGAMQGKQGTGMATEIGYSVPDKSFDFWKQRFKANSVKIVADGERFGESYVSFEDPDGLPLSLIVSKTKDERKPWETADVTKEVATKGFHSITLTLQRMEKTAEVLTDIFEYKLIDQEKNRYRYMTEAIQGAAIVDLLEAPNERRAINSVGTIHHVSFRVKNEEILMKFREKVETKGFSITPKIDRNYFFSLYFREPGGVLFEIATDNPGFSVDEPVSELGKNLKLPPQYEPHRAKIEEVLPSLS